MATSKQPARRHLSSAKVSKTYRLAPDKLAAAQRILGAATATEAIETALDMVVFRQELIDGTAAMAGTKFTSPDPD
ncbi:MAG: hypothetical protein H0U85_01805 [Gemmatimonadales bacterium]|nr:hypothetical protein [Gemmatimonadales bacterium]